MQFSKADILKLYNETFNMVVEKIPPKNGITRRIAQRFAILLATLCVCNKAWDLDMKIPPVLDLLQEAYMKNYASYDPILLAIESLKAEILNSNHLFLKDSKFNEFSQRARGVYGEYNGQKCLWVDCKKMDEMAKNAGIPSIKDIRKELADRGFLVRDKSHHYMFDKTIVNDIEAKCYGVYLRMITSDKKPKAVNSKLAKKTCSSAMSKSLEYLLSDDED